MPIVDEPPNVVEEDKVCNSSNKQMARNIKNKIEELLLRAERKRKSKIPFG